MEEFPFFSSTQAPCASAPFGKISSFFQPRFFFLPSVLLLRLFFLFFVFFSKKKKREEERRKMHLVSIFYILFELVCCENNRGERVEVCKSLKIQVV